MFDIETTPNRGWYYDASKEYNILETDQFSFICAVAYQWEGDKKVHALTLPDFPRYELDRKDDHDLVAAIYKLFEEADIIIGHNGDNFDVKVVNARLIFHRFQPPAPYKTADTLKLARRVQKSGSNRLDALARYYNIGKKLPNTGKDLWIPIAKGMATESEWRMMRRYNAHDVYLLAKLWPLLRPWGKTPNLNQVHGRPRGCPKCYGTHLHKHGKEFSYTLGHAVQMLRCVDCGARIYGEKVKLSSKIIDRGV